MKRDRPCDYRKATRSKVLHSLAPVSWEALQKLALKQTPERFAYEFIEGENFFELRISIPGCKRNDFNIIIKGRMLHLKVRCALTSEEAYKNLKSILNRPIILPGNLDPDFISAEYQNGTLTMYFFKSLCPCVNTVEEIFVY